MYARNLLYDYHILKSKSYTTPIICVGNLSVGGTGKTPMVEFLISRLQGEKTLAVLSRGYKRSSDGFQLGTEDSTVEQLGDEPFQIFRKYPEITVAVDTDRQNGIAQLQKHLDPDVILLDDAFQHRKVTPTFSILLTTFDCPYFKDWYLPTGNLRDAKYASRRADCVVVTKCPNDLKKDQKEFYSRRLKKSPNQTILFSTLAYDHRLYGSVSGLVLDDLKGKSFTLVTGIANPKPLMYHLTEHGLDFEHLKYADHHSFSSSEINVLKQKSLIVTTEKDYVRLKDSIENLCYVRVRHQFLDKGESELLVALDTKIKPYC